MSSLRPTSCNVTKVHGVIRLDLIPFVTGDTLNNHPRLTQATSTWKIIRPAIRSHNYPCKGLIKTALKIFSTWKLYTLSSIPRRALMRLTRKITHYWHQYYHIGQEASPIKRLPHCLRSLRKPADLSIGGFPSALLWPASPWWRFLCFASDSSLTQPSKNMLQ